MNAILRNVDPDLLRAKVDRSAHIRKRNPSGNLVPVPPPPHVIADMMVESPYPLPVLEAVASAPFFSSAGQLVLKEGYDATSRRFLGLPSSLQNMDVPDTPTRENVTAAWAVIDDLLNDFPFVTSADKANALAMLFDPFARTIHGSRTPLYVVSAPTAGTGKGLLIDALTMPATGAQIACTTLPSSDVELEKRLLSILLDGTSHVHFDNFEGSLTSSVLASFLTSDFFSGRPMGRSHMATLPQRLNCCLSGNNILVGGDIARRVVLIQLDAREAKPGTRSGFRHPDLIGWIREHRMEIVRAILILIRSWVVAGMRFGSLIKGSFEGWARTTSGILQHHGVEGLDANHSEVDTVADVEHDAWERFVEQWWNAHGAREITPAKLQPLLDLVDLPPFHIKDGATDRAISIQMGIALAKQRNRVFADWTITPCEKDTSTGSKRYKLTPNALRHASQEAV